VGLSTSASKGRQHTLGYAKNRSVLPVSQFTANKELVDKLNKACTDRCLADEFTADDGLQDMNALIRCLKEGEAVTYSMSNEERKEKLFTLFKATVRNPPASGRGPTLKSG
jgi:hypothetical protein